MYTHLKTNSFVFCAFKKKNTYLLSLETGEFGIVVCEREYKYYIICTGIKT